MNAIDGVIGTETLAQIAAHGAIRVAINIDKAEANLTS